MAAETLSACRGYYESSCLADIQPRQWDGPPDIRWMSFALGRRGDVQSIEAPKRQ